MHGYKRSSVIFNFHVTIQNLHAPIKLIGQNMIFRISLLFLHVNTTPHTLLIVILAAHDRIKKLKMCVAMELRREIEIKMH
jgi:hypothetical protein